MWTESLYRNWCMFADTNVWHENDDCIDSDQFYICHPVRKCTRPRCNSIQRKKAPRWQVLRWHKLRSKEDGDCPQPQMSLTVSGHYFLSHVLLIIMALLFWLFLELSLVLLFHTIITIFVFRVFLGGGSFCFFYSTDKRLHQYICLHIRRKTYLFSWSTQRTT